MPLLPPIPHAPDADRDLVLDRTIPVPPDRVWAAWTTPALLTQWFTPAPWRTIAAEIDLRPGGIFRTVMQSPEGEEFPSAGCVLEVVEERRLAWTGALGPGFRPLDAAAIAAAPFLFSAVITLEPHEGGTRYRALAIHADAAAREQHAAMGFHAGWGAALDQLVALMSR